MTIYFFIRYKTRYGQSLSLIGNNSWMGDDDDQKAIPLSWYNGDFWAGTIDFPNGFDDLIYYKYILTDTDGTQILDGDEDRFIDLAAYSNDEIQVIDTWNDAGSIGNIYFTRAFRKVLLPKVTPLNLEIVAGFTHEFRVKAPLLKPGETVCIIGSTKNLRSWDTENPVLMAPAGNWYNARLQFKDTDWPASYKYGIYDLNLKQFQRFESGENRVLFRKRTNGTTIICDGFFNDPPDLWRGCGVSVPVFSLRSNKSFGTGEFADLKLLVDWAVNTNLRLIQLLPVNDTTAWHNWSDSYPYAAISAFALHPLYINLSQVARKRDAPIILKLKKQQKQLNESEKVDYEQVMQSKIAALQELYQVQKNEFHNDTAFFAFFELNRDWLVPYACFCYLRDKYKTPDFSKWKKHSKFNEEAISKLASPAQKHYHQIAFFYYVQYHLHLQLKEVVEYAHNKHVVLKGDVPIGVYRFGCDAWMQPEFYNMDQQAGAPPDDFAVKGQNWGFPTYNWKRMQQDNYKWWRRRLAQMSLYFDAFRIDHILGFFRIWSIPMDAVEGILGRFVPAIPVSITEFHYYNVLFDYDRYCLPFINDKTVKKEFGEKADFVKSNLLDTAENNTYRLKDFINTQVKITAYCRQRQDFSLQQGLFNLVSNVILLEQPGSERSKYHFRISMDQTSSFEELESDTQNKLKQLYVDYFYRRQNDFWRKEGLKKLPAVTRSTDMLVCGEDLGMVPDCVPGVMKQLGILSLEVERMAKNSGAEFFHPDRAPYLSVVTPSTHDMSTIRGWWREDAEQTQRFYNNMLGHYGAAPENCAPWLIKEILLQHLYSPAMWSIFQLQDLMALREELRMADPDDERINVPADPNHQWNFRMKQDLELLIKNKDLNEDISRLVQESGRHR